MNTLVQVFLLLGLTVTKVVFEYEKQDALDLLASGLTVTKVVFELVLVVIMYLQVVRLTVTKVVFELYKWLKEEKE